MSNLATNDRLAGVILIGIGLFAAIYASTHYRLGSLAQLGPGMVPVILGVILVAGGVTLLILSLIHPGSFPQPDYRAAFFVVMATVLFALTVERLGVVPATTLMTVAAARADSKLSLVGSLILSAVLCAMVVLIFRVGLGLLLPIFVWSF